MNPNEQSPRKFSRKKWVAALLLAALSHAGVVYAAGMGRLNVQSRLGQPFSAEIELINLTGGDLATLNVSPAPPAAYQVANLPFDPALNGLRLSVERRANGTPYIRAISTRPVTEPYLHLLVVLTSQEGKLQRAYTALLDLPPVAEPAASTKPVAAAPAATAPKPGATVSAEVAPKSVAAAPRAVAPKPVAPTIAPKAEATPPPAPGSSGVPKPSVAPIPTQAVVPAPAAPAPAPDIAVTRSPVTPPATGNNTVAQPETKPADPAKSELVKPAPPLSGNVAAETPKAELPKPESKEPGNAPVPEPQAPVPQKVIVPPPQPQRSASDTSLSPTVLFSGVVLALLATVGGVWALRRRKDENELIASTVDTETLERGAMAAAAPAASSASSSAPAAVAAAPGAVTPTEATVSNVTHIVDPIDEARVYLEYGQDDRAENILREAMSKQPGREDIQMLLLEILAGRGDKDAFHQLAGQMHKQTGGQGGQWKRAMAMGYALDPSHPLYSPTDEVAAHSVPSPAGDSVVGIDPGSPAPAPDDKIDMVDIPLHRGAATRDAQETVEETSASVEPAAAALAPLPYINFELTSPKASTPDVPETAAEAPAAKGDSGIDFKVDFSAISPKPGAEAEADVSANTGEMDPLWEEIQQKIILARAYQEMGDKEGAQELLRDVEREGDAGQQAEAREMLQTLE